MSRSLFVAMLAISTMAVACSNSDRSTVAADNSARNKVDKVGVIAEPMDQGTSDSDVMITTVLRQVLTADQTLSVKAKNVKIIARDGIVTLRGPVESAAERAGIEAAAHAITGVLRVDSFLEVTGG
jgi:osmotically-inducible protein OsmY